jgi:hypothetical protein
MKYLSFLSGVYSTAPGLSSNNKAEGRERLVFQIDDTYDAYLNNKQLCRAEDITKYYCEHQLRAETVCAVNRFIAARLLSDYPAQFTGTSGEEGLSLKNKHTEEDITSGDWTTVAGRRYLSLFDALCSQVQEDVAIVQLGEEDFVTAIHLCAPNHWDPREKIGKPFYAVHAPVPAMERTLQHYQKMLASIAASPNASTRFAWGIATDSRLNHHPDPPPGTDPDDWGGRRQEPDAHWFVRSERQNLVGFPQVNAFMFTIRTYHYAVDGLSAGEKAKLLAAVRSMSPETLQYKGLAGSLSFLEKKLVG